MKIEVEIKNIGWHEGTSKWLAEGLESGELDLIESISEGGTLGLYLENRSEQVALAGYAFSGPPEAPHPYFELVDNFEVADEAAWNYLPSVQRRLRLTYSAVIALRQIARIWIKSKNLGRELDPTVDLSFTPQ